MAESIADGAAMQVEAEERRDGVQVTQDPVERSEGSGLGEPTAPFPKMEHTRTNLTAISGGRPYSSFSSREKWFIVILSAVAGTFSYVRLLYTRSRLMIRSKTYLVKHLCPGHPYASRYVQGFVREDQPYRDGVPVCTLSGMGSAY